MHMLKNMTYEEQRELGAELFPEIAAVILEESNCYADIAALICMDEDLKAKFLSSESLPPQWRYWWAMNIGNAGVMFDMEPKLEESSYWYDLWMANIFNGNLKWDATVTNMLEDVINGIEQIKELKGVWR